MSMSRWQRTAKTRWPKADWIHGDGQYAVVAACRNLTVTLHATSAQATAVKAEIDKTACGSSCRRNHTIVNLGS